MRMLEDLDPKGVFRYFEELTQIPRCSGNEKQASDYLVDFARQRKLEVFHSHASQLLRAGIHPKVVSERLGHASIGITLDTYSHVMPGMQAQAAERIDAGLQAALAGQTRTRALAIGPRSAGMLTAGWPALLEQTTA
jgi:hypothetical protein